MANVKPTVASGQKRCRLMIWCVPRSVSTALLKCLSFIEPATDDDSHQSQSDVWFEPFNMARFARMASKRVFGEEPPLESCVGSDFARRVEAQRTIFALPGDALRNADPYLLSHGGIKKSLEASEKKFVIVKDIAAAIHGTYDYIPEGFNHIFLIRDPNRAIPSLRNLFVALRKLDEATAREADMQEIHPFYAKLHWFGEIHALWTHVRANIDPNPLIIDIDDLLADPAPYLKQICDVIGAEYRDELLAWSASTDAIMAWRNGCPDMFALDLLWEGLGMRRAFESSHFVPAPTPNPSLSSLTPDCVRIVRQCEGWYREMRQNRYLP